MSAQHVKLAPFTPPIIFPALMQQHEISCSTVKPVLETSRERGTTPKRDNEGEKEHRDY